MLPRSFVKMLGLACVSESFFTDWLGFASLACLGNAMGGSGGDFATIPIADEKKTVGELGPLCIGSYSLLFPWFYILLMQRDAGVRTCVLNNTCTKKKSDP
jgi:hypothetical protein